METPLSVPQITLFAEPGFFCEALLTPKLIFSTKARRSTTDFQYQSTAQSVVSPLRAYSPGAESPLRASIGRASAPEHDEEGVPDLRADHCSA